MLGLEIEGVAMRYPDLAAPALDLPRLSVAPGESLAVTGPSGAGKSTFINVIAGLERATEGAIRWNGEDINAFSEAARDRWRARNVGLVMQDFHLFPGLSAEDNVLLPARFRHVRLPEGMRDRARALLAAVRIDAGARRIGTFSRGEMQRVAIARALVHRPALILADEPTGNLDPETATRVLEVLSGQIRSSGAAAVLVTHSEVAAAAADRVMVLGREGLAAAHA